MRVMAIVRADLALIYVRAVSSVLMEIVAFVTEAVKTAIVVGASMFTPMGRQSTFVHVNANVVDQFISEEE